MKLIVLDRDGTINIERRDFVKSSDEWVALEGALSAIARLNHAGWHVVVATNQSGLGRGLFDMSALNAMHDKMHRELALLGGRIDAVFFCPHTPDDACQCRKPLPGLFLQILKRTGAQAHSVHAVGDSLRDAQAAHVAGCNVHLVKTGNGEKTLSESKHLLPAQTVVHDDLAAFADYVIAHCTQPLPSTKSLDKT